jgi:hypothetical protein
MLVGRAMRRGLGIVAIGAVAVASTFCTLLIPPARDTWYSLVSELQNPMTRNQIADWQPLLVALRAGSWGSVEQQYFGLVLMFFIAAAVTVVLTPRGDDAPLVAVAAVMIAAAFTALRNIPFAAIAVAPVISNHLGLHIRPRDVTSVSAESARDAPLAGRLAIEVLIALVAIVIARNDGTLSGGIDASGYPVDAINFMQSHRLTGNVLTTFEWGQYVIFRGAPAIKVFIDSRYDEGYPPAVISDYLDFYTDASGGARTLAAYPHDFVLIDGAAAAVKLMNSQRDWRLIYSDDTSRLYARANSPAAHLDGVPYAGTVRPAFFP